LYINKYKFLINFDYIQYKKIVCCILIFSLSVFGHQNPGSGLDPDPYPDPLEMLDPDLTIGVPVKGKNIL
jgi:hypothetical protein